METPEQILAKNIKIRLAELRQKPVYLVKTTGLSRQTISKIMNGERQARKANLEAIATALKTSREWLQTPHPTLVDLAVKSYADISTKPLKNPELEELRLMNRVLVEKVAALEAKLEDKKRK